jgi:hypothetical protein
MKRAAITSFITALLLNACSDNGAVTGTEGGKCYPNGTCDAGLTCASSICVRLLDGGARDAAQDAGDDVAMDHGIDAQKSCEAVLGTKCTKSGSECGANNTCLVVSGTTGFCTCTCTPDNPATELVFEDTCPDTTKHKCVPFASGGSSGSFCLEYLGNSLNDCGTKYWHGWDSKTSTALDPLMVAVGLPAKSGPFTLTGIQYRLWNKVSAEPCSNTLPHRVEIWVDNVPFPLPSPTPAITLPSASMPSASLLRVIDFTLAMPIQLKHGEHVFIAVELAPDSAKTKTMCISHCAGTGESSFKTAGNKPPYSWSTVKSAGYKRDYAILALGFGG